MTLQVTWLGHSTFWLEWEGKTVLIDPFITHNPFVDKTPGDFKPDVILITHAHGDHVGDTNEGVAHDTVTIAKQSGSLVIANFEIANKLGALGVENATGGNPGGTLGNDFMSAKITQAFHSSSFGDGTYGGEANGLVIRIGGKTLYHAGDTSLFGDMALIGEEGIDLAFLPIGDMFTMGVDDSIRATKLIEPAYVMPIHYNTFPPIAQDASAWAERIHRETDAQPIVIDPGLTHTLD